MLLYAVIRIASQRPLRAASAEILQLQAREQSLTMENLRAIHSVKVNGMESRRHNEWHAIATQALEKNTRIQKLGIFFSTVYGLIFSLESIAVLGLGAWSAVEPEGAAASWVGTSFTVGMLMAFVAYKDQFSQRIRGLIDKGMDLYLLGLQTEMLADIVVAKREQTLGSHQIDPDENGVNVELRNVGFRYSEQSPWIMKGFSINIAAGEQVAVTGPSGCGKTTLLKIILGLIEPTEGIVLVNGVPVRKIGLAAWRKLTGAVLQDDHLFSGNIRENIAAFAETVDDKRLYRAAELAGIDAEIRKMPMGYYTRVLDLGSNLSGGQKQRVLIARALYRNPAVLAFDEATSHLDVDNERFINAGMAKISATRIVIAHRPETIKMCGRTIDLGTLALPRPKILSKPTAEKNAVPTV